MSEKIRLTALESSRLPETDRSDALRFCPKCGRQIPQEQQICTFCGNTGEIPRPVLPRRQKLLILAAVIFFMLLLLFALDLAIRSAGPVPTPVITPEPTVRGTTVPVILIP